MGWNEGVNEKRQEKAENAGIKQAAVPITPTSVKAQKMTRRGPLKLPARPAAS
jgi:hypothetical protein